MKKKVLLTAGALALLVVFTGCHKFFDWKHHGHQHGPNCRVKKITSFIDGDTVVSTFHYNHKGDPVSILRSATITASPHMFFQYDHKGRLKELLGRYHFEPNGLYDTWITYKHDWKGRIINDTVYSFGNIVNNVPQPNPSQKSCNDYEYDAWDRMVKMKHTFVLPGLGDFTTTYDFIYDADGNLVDGYFPPYYYGNKRNIRHTHKLWMFLDRNYSVNDEAGAVAHNAAGLPLRYEPFQPGSRSFAISVDIRHAEIEYDCW